MLLDEPTASLDPRQRRRLWEIAAQVRERGGAVVFATQNLEELDHVASRVVVLLDGGLVFDGSLEEFRPRPGSGRVRMTKIRLLLAKDLRVLGRSPALVAALVLYPLVFAVLVGLVVRYASDRPRVAFVDRDRLPETLTVGGQSFNVPQVISEVQGSVDLVPMSEEEAEHQLAAGGVVAEIIVPPGFASKLRGMVDSPQLVLKTAQGGLSGPRRAADTGTRLRAQPPPAGRVHRRQSQICQPHPRGWRGQFPRE